MPDAPFHPLASADDLHRALEQSEDGPVVLYKHSSACPISAQANDEMESLAGNGGPPIYRVVVQESRDVSDAIAERFSIRHETPQAIVVEGEQSVFDASHRDVTTERVQEVTSKSR